MSVIIYRSNLNISPKMSYCVLECDVMLQNYMLMILYKKKGEGVICAGPYMWSKVNFSPK